MRNDVIGIVIILLIWIINGKNIFFGIKNKLAGEVYHHIGMGLFFALIVIEKFFEIAGMLLHFDILWLKIIGYVLFIPSILFIFGSLFQLKIKGKADSLGPQGTSRLEYTGVFSIVRHPMWIGFSLWSFALILCFQSLLSLFVSAVAIILFRLASLKEDDEGVKAFGDNYYDYMEKVPMWNFLQGLSSYIVKRST